MSDMGERGGEDREADSPGAPPPAPSGRNRRKDFWQLDVPLALVLIVCTILTVVELRRAGEGIWRAWVYTFEWPVIAGVCIWMWRRFRTEGTSTRSFTQRWRDRVAQYEAEAEAAERAQGSAAAAGEAEGLTDPDLVRWQEYQERLRADEEARGPG